MIPCSTSSVPLKDSISKQRQRRLEATAPLRAYAHDAGTHPAYRIGRYRIGRAVLARGLRRLDAEDPLAHALLVGVFAGQPVAFGSRFPGEVHAALGKLLGYIFSR